MNSNSSNNLFSQSDILFAKPYLKKIPNSSKDSPLPKEFEEKNNKNSKYFPIASKHSFTGKHSIYLSTRDNDNKDINNSSNKENIDSYSNKKVKKKLKNKQKIFMQQRSIEFQIKKTKFEYLLNLPVKTESKNNDKEKSSNEENKKDEKIYSIKEETDEENKNNNYKNIKDDFMATTKKLFDKDKKRKNKSLNHSYSVESYSGFLNKDFLSNFTDNMQNLENSKIIENNFIGKFKNISRKNNLMKLLEKYKRFKSYSHRTKLSDPLNKSFTFGFNPDNYRQKSTEKKYDIKNIIEEDENENSEAETMKLKANSKITDKVDNKYDILERKEKKIIKKSKEEIILAEKLKEIKSNIQNDFDDGIDNDININSSNNDDIDKDKLPNINHNNDIEINLSINEKNSNNNKYEINMEKYKNNYKSNNANNEKEIDINKIYFDSNNTNKENEKENLYKKYNKNKDIKSDIKDQKENNNPNSNLINRINKIKNKIDNNIFKNIDCTKAKRKNNNQEVLVRKILREERYIIDENGQEKVLEVNQSLLNSNNNFKFVVKNRRNKDSLSSINNITNNYTTNLDEKILAKEKHLGKNHKILVSEKNLDTIDAQNKNPKIKIEYSYKNSKRIPNDLVKRKYTCTSPITSIYKNAQSKTTQNSQEKETDTFKNINISKINKPIVIKRIDRITKNSLNNHNRIDVKNIDNNNSKHVFYYQNQISPTLSPSYRKYYNSKIELRKKLDKNNNHSYYEITSINRRKNSQTSKTIFQDYRNYDKGVSSHKSTASLNNINKNVNVSGNILGRNLTSYNFQKHNPNSNSNLIPNNYNRDESSKNRKKFSNERNKTESDFKYCRNIIKDENKNIFQKRRNIPESNRDINNNYTKSITSTKYINSISKNIPKYQSFRFHNKNLGQSMSNIYHENIINRLNKVHLVLKSSFSSNNFNYNIDDRRQNVLK